METFLTGVGIKRGRPKLVDLSLHAALTKKGKVSDSGAVVWCADRFLGYTWVKRRRRKKERRKEEEEKEEEEEEDDDDDDDDEEKDK